MNKIDALRLFNLNSNYDEKILKECYKSEIRKVHPDLNPNLRNAKEKTQMLNEAYEFLLAELNGKNINYTQNYNYQSTKTYKTSFDFFEYRNNVIEDFQKKCNRIFINKKYSKEEDFDIYSNLITFEFMYYKTFLLLIHTYKSKREICFSIESFKNDRKQMVDEFVNTRLDNFYKNYQSNNNEDKFWLQQECRAFKYKWFISSKDCLKNINDAMEFVIQSKNTIAKQFVTNQIVFYINDLLSLDLKNYMDVNNIQAAVIDILSKKYDMKYLINNENIIFKETKKYINLKKKDYNKFLNEKDKKIKELINLIKINELDLDELKKYYFEIDINSLKEEMNEVNFNKKYLFLGNKVQELLKYKEATKIKSIIDNCSVYLTKRYNKTKSALRHEENFKKSLYYLSMILENEIEFNNIELLFKLKFKNLENDLFILNQIETNILSKENQEKNQKNKTKRSRI